MRISSATVARTKPTTRDTKTSFVDTDHLGWLRCDGRGLNKIAYNLLFGVIGYTFGGSGNTFNLPDGRGRVVGNKGTVVDACNPAGVAFPSGTVTGEVTHKLTIAEMPAHNHNNAGGSPGINTTAAGTTSINGEHIHGITDPGHTHSYINQPNSVSPAVSLTTTDVADNVNVNQTTGSSTTQITINSAGSHTHTPLHPMVEMHATTICSRRSFMAICLSMAVLH
jgi:microcystin-dependent protein